MCLADKSSSTLVDMPHQSHRLLVYQQHLRIVYNSMYVFDVYVCMRTACNVVCQQGKLGSSAIMCM
jgi:hypothetical protein